MGHFSCFVGVARVSWPLISTLSHGNFQLIRTDTPNVLMPAFLIVERLNVIRYYSIMTKSAFNAVRMES